MNERRCACRDADARTCYDLRYYGYSPVMRGQAYGELYYVQQPTLTAAELDDGECPCICHEDDLDDQDDDPEGQGYHEAQARDLAPELFAEWDEP
jgi:hypothetical protein